MTRHVARIRALRRAADIGLDPNTADAAVSRAMEVFHEELTDREWMNFVDQEIQRHAQE